MFGFMNLEYDTKDIVPINESIKKSLKNNSLLNS